MTADKSLSVVEPHNALLEAIYESALDPSRWLSFRQMMLKNFRQDLLIVEPSTHFLELIKRHLKRALHMALAKERAQQERIGLSGAITAIAPAVCIIQQDGRLIGKNLAADQLLVSHSAFSIKDERLVCLNAAWWSELLVTVQAQGYACKMTTVPSEGNPLVYVFSRADNFVVAIFEHAGIIEQAMQQIYTEFGLTEKELAVLQTLMSGVLPQHYAKRLGVNPQTVRKHLSSVYYKTATTGQNELLALLLRHTMIREVTADHGHALRPQILGLAHSHFIAVQQGRQLCYAEYGDTHGVPVLYFCMLNGSRLELLMHHELLRQMGIRLIAVDRPGYGHSDFYDYVDYCEYISDIAILLDTLNIQRCKVLGCSAGTPHALACAAVLPERVTEVICAGSVPPYKHIVDTASPASTNRLLNNLFRIAPVLLRPALELMLSGQTAESIFRVMTDNQSNWYQHSPVDVEFMHDPAHMDYFMAYMIESLRQGGRAWAKEMAMLNQNWRIPLDSIRCPVQFWHGTDDTVIAPQMVQSFAAELPNSQVRILDKESHLLVFRHLKDIIINS